MSLLRKTFWMLQRQLFLQRSLRVVIYNAVQAFDDFFFAIEIVLQDSPLHQHENTTAVSLTFLLLPLAHAGHPGTP